MILGIAFLVWLLAVVHLLIDHVAWEEGMSDVCLLGRYLFAGFALVRGRRGWSVPR